MKLFLDAAPCHGNAHTRLSWICNVSCAAVLIAVSSVMPKE